MRDLATCYSEHAVRVYDSYCSGPLNRPCASPKLIPFIKDSVSFTYKTKISPQRHLLITITWSFKIICQGFWIKIREKMRSPLIKDPCPNPMRLSAIKGSKTFQYCNSNVQVHWDLSNAKFESGPEPISGFYIVVLVDGNPGLVLGDMEGQKITVGLPVAKFMLVSQCEDISGNHHQFSAKARFCDSGLSHDILVRFDEEDRGAKGPILSILIDNKRVIKMRRLRWNFRGNEIVFVDGVMVDVMWDVHGWFSDQGNAVFMFRTRSSLDSWLWFLEKNLNEMMNQDKTEFSLIICARKNTC